MQAVDYYNELFTLVYGDSVITEDRIQKAIAQFVRSIQSFDSRYDEGYKQDFANFIESEKRGMELFTTPPLGASRRGLDCFHCHRPPAFDIKPDAGNNGVIGVANKPGEIDISNGSDGKSTIIPPKKRSDNPFWPGEFATKRPKY